MRCHFLVVVFLQIALLIQPLIAIHQYQKGNYGMAVFQLIIWLIVIDAAENIRAGILTKRVDWEKR